MTGSLKTQLPINFGNHGYQFAKQITIVDYIHKFTRAKWLNHGSSSKSFPM